MNGSWVGPSTLPTPLWLGLRHARHHPGRSLILTLCVAVSIALPASVRTLFAAFRADLVARADSTPLLVGEKGSRFDLAMSLLYFRPGEVMPISMADFRSIQSTHAGTIIPINLRFTARGRPIVATTPEYYTLRAMKPALGTLPLMIGDATFGGRAARELDLAVGAEVYSDQREVFDISKPQALRLRVVGVLPETGLPEDDAVFVDLKTAWILEGLSHAHVAPTDVPQAMVLGQSEASVAISEELIDDNRVTPANAASFHLHADDAQLPLTGLIVRPDSVKEATLLTSRLNAGRVFQAVVPAEVVRDLLAHVLRVRTLLEGVSAVVGGTTAALFTLIVALSVRVRTREIQTYRKIGVSRGSIVLIFASELFLLIGAGAVLAVAAAIAASAWGASLVKLL